MEFHKPKFRKNNYRDTQDNSSSGYRGPRSDRSSGYNRSSRSGGSRFSRGSENDRRGEMHSATCGDCGNECQIPFKPKYDRPVYCKECFQDHKPQEDSGSRFNRNSRYDKGSTKFQRDRIPIHGRENFGEKKYPSNIDESYQKYSRDDSHDNPNSFYSTLRKKLFTVLGEKKCANCGFDDERALGFEPTDNAESFDYIHRAGAASSWKKYVSDPDLAKKELQVICLNCNMIKQKTLD